MPSIGGLRESDAIPRGQWGESLAPAPIASFIRLDGFEVQRAGLVVAVCADLIGQALTNLRGMFLDIPAKRAPLEVQFVATRFGLERAAALIDVKRVDCAKLFHVEFLCFQAPEAAPVG